MKRHAFLFGLLFTLVGAATFAGITGACSSSGSSDNSVGASNGAVTVTDLNTFPDLDFTSADTSANSSLSAMKANSAVGDASSAGCMSINFFKPLALMRIKQADIFRCYIEKTQDADPMFVIPTDEYAYYQINMAGASSVRVRIGNFVTDSATTLRMEVGNSSDRTTFTPQMEFRISGNASTLTWTGSVVEHFTYGSESGCTSTSFNVLMKSADAMQQEFSIANVSTIDATNYFGRTPTGSCGAQGTTYADVFRLRFGLNASERNITEGSFANSSAQVSGLMCSEFDATSGVAVMNYSSGGSEVFNDTEAFSTGTKLVIDPSGVSFYSSSSCNAVPSAVTEADVNSNVAFSTTDFLDDCTLPDGETLVTIDGSAIDYSACDALSAAVSGFEHPNNSSCFGSENNSTFPSSFTFTPTGSSTTCDETWLSRTPLPEIPAVIFTKTSETDSAITLTAAFGETTRTFSGTKTGNNWTLPADSEAQDLNSCSMTESSAFVGTIEPLACSKTVTYTAVSGDSCTQTWGDDGFTPIIGASGTCTHTYTGTCVEN